MNMVLTEDKTHTTDRHVLDFSLTILLIYNIPALNHTVYASMLSTILFLRAMIL